MSCPPTRETGIAAPLADNATRVRDLAEEGGVDTGERQERCGPVAFGDVDESRAAGAGAFRDGDAGEVVHDQFGQPQQAGCSGKLVGVVHGELEDRVERQELQSVDVVHPLGAELVDDAAVSVGAVVAV